MVSYSIMAHPKRDEYAYDLQDALGATVSFDLGHGLWENAKTAWEVGLKKKSDYHFVIQDDAILCEGFQDKVQALIERYPDKAYCLYTGENLKTLRGKYSKTVVHDKVHWGVGLGLPTQHIKPFLRFGSKLNRMYSTKHCDTRLSRYCNKTRLKVVYPCPSLVDHRQLPSLVGDSIGRKAYKF